MTKMALYLFGLPPSNPSSQDYHKKIYQTNANRGASYQIFDQVFRTIKIIQIRKVGEPAKAKRRLKRQDN